MTKLTAFDKYFSDTCTTINQKIKDNYPAAAVEGILSWAQANEPGLFKAEEQSCSLIDPAWNESIGLDKFEKIVLDLHHYHRVIL